MKSPNKRLIGMMMAIAFILCIPLIAMQFTNEVNWTLSDFVMMGILLISTGLLVELVLRKVTKIQHRIILCALLIFGLFIVWAELAVGIFGTPFAGN
ncbi:hypothetical protein [Pedobacter cryophilus]|uniref:Uncharacterized protein n=1 Tax=Pedobacter cryophilus TaxID=2571271 RepID=A0A4U1C1H0_9SPHI|nr:hypothetical protein [Pedobacter cryophilus]TKB98915.1 hypothetical protein FA046_07310 [Pedobacter cryophilus]